MKINLTSQCTQVTTQFALAVPVVGFISDLAGNYFFKQYLAEVLVNIFGAFGTALIHVVVQRIFYGGIA